MQNNNNLTGLDLLTIVSFYIAIKNLKENEQQSDILQTKLDDQDNVYLKKTIELLEKSIEQNDLIIKQNEELLKRR